MDIRASRNNKYLFNQDNLNKYQKQIKKHFIDISYEIYYKVQPQNNFDRLTIFNKQAESASDIFTIDNNKPLCVYNYYNWILYGNLTLIVIEYYYLNHPYLKISCRKKSN